MMPNSDPRDRFVCPFLKLVMDSFSCILLGANTVFVSAILKTDIFDDGVTSRRSKVHI